MQGYILNINKVRDEDLIITLLTQSRVLTLYRFYGTRHSKIQLGFKLDFETNLTAKNISLLSNTSHIAPRWLFDRTKFYLWQQLCILYHAHLRGLDEIDDFYYDIFETMSSKLVRQNPKRTFLEGYIELLAHEGRLSHGFICANCNQKIIDKVSFGRAFLAFHKHCAYSKSGSLNVVDMYRLFSQKTSLHLDDTIVDKLYKVLELGL